MTKILSLNLKNEKKISKESKNMKFLNAVGSITISLTVWLQLFAENEREIWHIVPSFLSLKVLTRPAEKPWFSLIEQGKLEKMDFELNLMKSVIK